MSKANKEDVSREGAEGAKEAAAPEGTVASKRSRKKWPIAVGVVAAVLVVAVASLWVWHEQPSFCSAICHSPMDPYLPTYEVEPGQASTDKWGNAVADAAGMMAASHRAENGDTCMSCHVPTLDEQVSEGMAWLAGDYYDPLDERTLDELTAARGLDGEAFCLNESCHNMTRDELKELYASENYNPHADPHGNTTCGDCHKAHRASVMQCTGCHQGTMMPDGWITASEEKQLGNVVG